MLHHEIKRQDNTVGSEEGDSKMTFDIGHY